MHLWSLFLLFLDHNTVSKVMPGKIFLKKQKKDRGVTKPCLHTGHF